MTINELEACGIDWFGRPLCRHKTTGIYYCVLEEGITFHDVLKGDAELYYKGRDREDEPSHPVELMK
ncbi:hypothetical protein [Vreelandella sulfidaeris]|uniref:Uncharacterized protein n=1 Tax=Vreelandella sulfidaeris TaxID=115553 RepID=A0A455UB34_9GAMM|nr:hypothetical protein HSBAA_30550 [Halomonas sulfidaeris]